MHSIRHRVHPTALSSSMRIEGWSQWDEESTGASPGWAGALMRLATVCSKWIERSAQDREGVEMAEKEPGSATSYIKFPFSLHFLYIVLLDDTR